MQEFNTHRAAMEHRYFFLFSWSVSISLSAVVGKQNYTALIILKRRFIEWKEISFISDTLLFKTVYMVIRSSTAHIKSSNSVNHEAKII